MMQRRVETTDRGFALLPFLAYNGLALPLMIAAYHLARFTHEKAREGIEGRRRLFQRLELRHESLRGCVWFHASSAGEYEQARPLIRAFREEVARKGLDVPTLQTVFSPSGFDHASAQLETDALEYLPLDTYPAGARMLDLLAPRAVVFVKYDVWPNLTWAARRRGVPLLLLDATLHRRSQRLQPLARGFFSSVYSAFDRIGAISQDDADRFRISLGVREGVVVTGDTRVDQVIHRFEASAQHPLPRHLQAQGYRYFTLGSLWPADERVVLDAALDAAAASADRGLIVVPHEPTPSHLDQLSAAVQARGLSCSRLSELIEPSSHQRRSTAAARDPKRWRVILVDTVGILAELYRASVLSYVGGGFSTGVHSVLEPAVTGQPVLFGPRHHNAIEAERLLRCGGAYVVGSPSEMRQRLGQLLEDESERTTVGERARDYVFGQQDATEQSLALLRPYVFGAEPPDTPAR